MGNFMIHYGPGARLRSDNGKKMEERRRGGSVPRSWWSSMTRRSAHYQVRAN